MQVQLLGHANIISRSAAKYTSVRTCMSSNLLVLRAKTGKISALRKFLKISIPCSRISSDGLTAKIYSAACSEFLQHRLLALLWTKDSSYMFTTHSTSLSSCRSTVKYSSDCFVHALHSNCFASAHHRLMTTFNVIVLKKIRTLHLPRRRADKLKKQSQLVFWPSVCQTQRVHSTMQAYSRGSHRSGHLQATFLLAIQHLKCY